MTMVWHAVVKHQPVHVLIWHCYISPLWLVWSCLVAVDKTKPVEILTLTKSVGCCQNMKCSTGCITRFLSSSDVALHTTTPVPL